MHTVYLLLGSNLGDRMQHFSDATLLIKKEIGSISKSSSIYETAPWGYTKQPAFINQVIEVKSDLIAAELLKNILEIEKKLGRTRLEKWHERTIDIDILFYDAEIINHPDLKIPHPHLHERRFTLAPLNDIAKDLVHPVLKVTVSELLLQCNDQTHVEKLNY